jgi:membrane associated rhomboid family serine protease
LAVIFPYATDRALSRPTIVTIALVVINIVVYIGFEVASVIGFDPASRVWFDLVLDRGGVGSHRVITYAFLHGGLWHVAGNMLFLWTFGPNLEDRLGRAWFLLFYLGAAATSGALHTWFDGTPVIGASGAIAGVTGAYMVLFPRTQIRAFFILTIGILSVPAAWMIGTQILWDLVFQGFSPGSRVARLAHLAGYGYGASIAMALLWLRVIPREPFDLFTMGRQAYRRRQFREIEFQRQRAASAAARAGGVVDDGPRASMRARVLEELSAARLDQATTAYVELLRLHGRENAVLAPGPQRDVANALFQSGDHANAAVAYDIFIESYRSHAQTPTARLMLGLINARYLNDPVRAKQEIQRAMPGLNDPEQVELAKALLSDLG